MDALVARWGGVGSIGTSEAFARRGRSGQTPLHCTPRLVLATRINAATNKPKLSKSRSIA